jgi:acyl-CoA synthetase (NDP forming)
MLALDDESALRSGWRELERRVHATGREWIGAIVQCMVAPGGDVPVGAVSDPDLGPVLGVGFGGRRAGLARTVAFRLLPVTDAEADGLIDSAEGVATELDGFRGSAALDRQALRELMLRFALLLREVPEVVETDLNPVRCMTSGCVVLDTRLRVQRRRPIDRVQTW